MPSRSRARYSVRALRSHNANANIPMVRSTAASTPHSAQASSSTSVSESLRIARPAAASSLTDIAVVVDLAVEGDDVTPVGRMHRLRTAGTEIDDREPALRQHGAALGLDPDPAAVGTAMSQRFSIASPIERNASADVAARQSIIPAIPHIPAPEYGSRC